MLPGLSCLQVWWHLSDGTPEQGPSSRARAACAGGWDRSCNSEAQTSALLGTSPQGGGAGSSLAGPGLCPCPARPRWAVAAAEAAGLLHSTEPAGSHAEIPICKPRYW